MILLNAFITRITIELLENFDIKYTLIKRIDDKKYNNRDALKFNNSKQILIDIINQLKVGKKLLILYP